LGKGLGSLIPKKEIKQQDNSGGVNTKDSSNQSTTSTNNGVLFVSVDKIDANPYQPRESFEKKDLADLSSSIKEHGILQPLMVNKESDGRYELIAGERRLRASKIAGLKEVPVMVKEVGDFDKLQLAIIENVQRANLNPIEEAKSFDRLVKEFDMTHEDVAKKIGKSRSFVSNTLRLLKLPDEIKEAVSDGRVSAGQSRSLVSLSGDEQKRLFDQVINEKLSARDVEDEARKVAVKKHTRVIKKDPILGAKEDRLQELLGTKVSVKKKKEGGQIIIDFYSPEELDTIIEKISK